MFLMQKAHCDPANFGKEPELMIIQEERLEFIEACVKQAKDYTESRHNNSPVPGKMSFIDKGPRWIEYGIALEDCDFWPFLKANGAVLVRELPEFMRDGQMEIKSGPSTLEVDIQKGNKICHVADMDHSGAAVWTDLFDLNDLGRLPLLGGEWRGEKRPEAANCVHLSGNPGKTTRRLRSSSLVGPGR